MSEYKDQLIEQIEQKSRKKAAMLSREFVAAKPEEKEEIFAGIEFERWLADSCRDCQKE